MSICRVRSTADRAQTLPSITDSAMHAGAAQPARVKDALAQDNGHSLVGAAQRLRAECGEASACPGKSADAMNMRAA